MAKFCAYFTLCLMLGLPSARMVANDLPVEIAGTTLTPHVRSSALRYADPPEGGLGARVEIFVRHTSPRSTNLQEAVHSHVVTFAGREPHRLVRDGDWAWHDTPTVWSEEEVALPAGALSVWSFNTRQTRWGPGARFTLSLTDWQRARKAEFPMRLERPDLWLSTVSFLSSDKGLMPDTVVFHIVNAGAAPMKMAEARLYLPEKGANWRHLFPHWQATNLMTFPADGVIPPGGRGGAKMQTGRLPLANGVLEVVLRDGAGNNRSLWASQRVRREVFDIGAGAVSENVGWSNSLSCEPYLKTLKRMHVNTANITAVPGYTDQQGPGGFYNLYPLKLFGKLSPATHDTDAFLPLVHAVQFLGEPQNEETGQPKHPQTVQSALLPYQPTRLPTAVTLTDESYWAHYAGLSDFPNLSAFRVVAPAADEWTLYQRWEGKSIAWGAPLETLGEMCRSLREISRPKAIACWVQGPYHGWDDIDGRRRASPTADEIRLQAYQALSSRITSLYWYQLNLQSLVDYRDTIGELTRIGREIKLLEEFYLEGDACFYQQTTREGRLDWDLAAITSPRGSLLFALDLAYMPDRSSRTFEFKRPREARFLFSLPTYARHPLDVFRIDAEGIYDARFQITPEGIEILDRQNKVAIYVASLTPQLRTILEGRRQYLINYEQSLNFDPADKDRDFAVLRHILRP